MTTIQELSLIPAEDLSDQMRSVLSEMGGQVVDDAVDLDYDHWSACEWQRISLVYTADSSAEVLNSILPDVDDGDAPSSFTHTGHIGRSDIAWVHILL